MEEKYSFSRRRFLGLLGASAASFGLVSMAGCSGGEKSEGEGGGEAAEGGSGIAE